MQPASLAMHCNCAKAHFSPSNEARSAGRSGLPPDLACRDLAGILANDGKGDEGCQLEHDSWCKQMEMDVAIGLEQPSSSSCSTHLPTTTATTTSTSYQSCCTPPATSHHASTALDKAPPTITLPLSSLPSPSPNLLYHHTLGSTFSTLLAPTSPLPRVGAPPGLAYQPHSTALSNQGVAGSSSCSLPWHPSQGPSNGSQQLPSSSQGLGSSSQQQARRAHAQSWWGWANTAPSTRLPPKPPLLPDGAGWSPTVHWHPPQPPRLPSMAREARWLWSFAAPCVVAAGAEYVAIIISNIMAWRLGPESMAAVGLGSLAWTVVTLALDGCCTALEALGAHAIGNHDKAGLVAWSFAACICLTSVALVAMVLLCIPTWLFTVWSSEPQLVATAVMYCRSMAPGLLPQVWALLMFKHLQVQGCVWLPARAVIGATLLHWAASLMLTEAVGVVGLGAAGALSRIFLAVSMASCVAVFETEQGLKWGCPSTRMKAVQRWQRARRWCVLSHFMRYGSLGAANAMLQGGGALLVMACLVNTVGWDQAATHPWAFLLAAFALLCLPSAMALTTSCRVANLLGCGAAARARRCTWLMAVSGSCLAAAAGAVMCLWPGPVGVVFTDDIAVAATITSAAPVLAAIMVGCGCLWPLSGAMTGQGRQGLLLLLTCVGWAAGALAGSWLHDEGWHEGHHGGRGAASPELHTWHSCCLGLWTCCMLVGGVLWRMDWQRQVPEARLMQAVHRGPEHTQSLIQHALEEDAAADEQVAAALLEEAQYDPRPLHIIYQDMFKEGQLSSQPDAPPHPNPRCSLQRSRSLPRLPDTSSREEGQAAPAPAE